MGFNHLIVNNIYKIMKCWTSEQMKWNEVNEWMNIYSNDRQKSTHHVKLYSLGHIRNNVYSLQDDKKFILFYFYK